MISNFLTGLQLAISIPNLLGISFGYCIGVIVGAIPGLTATMAISLLVPITYPLDPILSVSMLMGCYAGGVYGGSISAILLNTPGAPGSAATSLDGYPLYLQGKGKKALGMALTASVFGGLFSSFVLLFLAEPVSMIALKFGPPEFATLIFLSLTIIASTVGDTVISILKGLCIAMVGLLVSMVGLDPITAGRRYVFSFIILDRGLPLIPVLIGMLALSEIFLQTEQRLHHLDTEGISTNGIHDDNPENVWVTWKEVWFYRVTLLRSSLIGTLMGALPGIGATTAAFLSYDQAKKYSKRSKNFGKGELEGVAAPEAGNNAVCAAALIPLITLGIPGSVAAAVLGGAFLIHGMMPGPMLMVEHPDKLYALFILVILSNFIGYFLARPFIRVARNAVKIRPGILFPLIVVFCALGAYGINLYIFDMKLMFLFGIFGYLLKKYEFSVVPFILAFILGPFAEESFRQSMILSDGSFLIFFTRPIAVLFIGLSILSILWSVRNIKVGAAQRTGRSDD